MEWYNKLGFFNFEQYHLFVATIEINSGLNLFSGKPVKNIEDLLKIDNPNIHTWEDLLDIGYQFQGDDDTHNRLTILRLIWKALREKEIVKIDRGYVYLGKSRSQLTQV
jgi:hypothetical protein